MTDKRKAKTISLKGNDYARVPERIRMFREECPYGKIETTPIIQENGELMFKAEIVKNQQEVGSARATGHSLGDSNADKSFEKLETIAVGRALANLGYLASGEVASAEEMEDFLKNKKAKEDKEKEGYIEKLNAVDSLEKLKELWGNINPKFKVELSPLKDKIKAKYESN